MGKRKKTKKDSSAPRPHLLVIVGTLAAVMFGFVTWNNYRENSRARVFARIDPLQPNLSVPMSDIAKQGYIEIPYKYVFEDKSSTPAKNSRVMSTWSFGEQPITIFPSEARRDRVGEIPPGQEFSNKHQTHSIRLTGDNIQEWLANREFVWVYVRIEYNDTNIASFRHHTWVCTKNYATGEQTIYPPGGRTD